MADLKAMFPDVDPGVVNSVLRDNNGRINATIDCLLIISADNVMHIQGNKANTGKARENYPVSAGNPPFYQKTTQEMEANLQKTDISSFVSSKNKSYNDPPPPPGNLQRFGSLVISSDETCAICLNPLNVGILEDEEEASNYDFMLNKPSSSLDRGDKMFVFELTSCKHVFHIECTQSVLGYQDSDEYLECPLCKSISGTKVGTQPVSGKMTVTKRSTKLPGFETDSRGMIVVTYSFTGGIQGPKHPNPGQAYSARSFPRTAYFPDNERGERVVDMIRLAFDRKLVFTVGRSLTTGEENVITWNEIHHKTQISNPSYGYPDPNYLDNVERELKTFGISEKDVSHPTNTEASNQKCGSNV